MEAQAIDTIWVLIASVLVFFMQAGFAMVEAGFTRGKNAANIMMKNLMDYTIGTLIFWILGFSIMFGSDQGGFIGNISIMMDGDFSHIGLKIPLPCFLIFQTVFAATAATIVSGAMAERTKFITYLVYSLVISGLIYPIVGHWIWGGGWLSQRATPFHDFAGSTVVHSVGGWAAIVGAFFLGPRIGKYVGGKSMAIPGHNLVIAALGVFILWVGWFGFNPGSTLSGMSIDAISHIFVTTNIAAAAGALATMIVSWFKYKKPDLSMTLNGALAGLVAITAGCDIVSFGGAALIGLFAGIIVLFAVELIDKIVKIDDPVGAVSVHGICGAFGTMMVGLFATDGGLFYGGDSSLFITQIVGVFSVAAWTIITTTILFLAIKYTIGLRVSETEEIEGLDLHEHGQVAYNVS